MNKYLVSLAVLAGVSGPVAAQDQCMSLKGSVIQPMTFEQIQSQFPTVEPKGEFETTAEYDARKSSAGSSAPNGPLFVMTEAHKAEGFMDYDADRGAFSINAYDFNGGYYSSSLDRFGGPFHTSSYRDKLVGVGLSKVTEVTGTYEATNGFGAKVEVVERNVTRYELVEGNQRFRVTEAALWKGSTYEEVGYLTAPPQMARDIKPRLRSAIMFTPKAPFFVEHTSLGQAPTRRNPNRDTIETQALVGDMQCAIIYDSADNSIQWGKATR